ncbi:S-adenosyl-L-methionine-dependent methyltransferase [Lindgomyces ingoldianus]|uniref:S-adenosyl-L-methionine-dependent methyltransferase n=1 Tax=Lindgomyces ingoldianus TaxID=673940 RepID=A0ACB6RCG4_9PLEO|nr:S-adenosyl-L-methionine-dependent methyltransferase [Lindgomyces ingoldianus]KAF2476217.1 S-adenosyl-L-methionine-dependent methyltransferase [Lindgomyces ingoldianus]
MWNYLLLRRPVHAQISSIITTRQLTSGSFLRRAFQEDDVVLLRDKKDPSHDGILVRLQQSKSVHTHRGYIEHADVIGKRRRQIVRSSKGTDYRIHEPTLAEYVRLTPRIVTPIYPSDANLMVSLLDIHVHVSSATPHNSPPLEILEAGTGHGALTLHLSRAIHAGNPPVPAPPYASSHADPEDAVYLGESVSDLQESNLESWKASRRAIIHTLDISSKHSRHARKIVQGFRRGLYAGNVDFHVGDISAWITSQRTMRKTEDAFLSYVFLDLPNANDHLANVAPVLHVDGLLAVFNPSITQIAECVETIREHRLPYLLDQVIELGAGCIRQWDVRSVRPRATLQEADRSCLPLEDAANQDPASTGQDLADAVGGQAARDDELAENLTKHQDKWAMVCRPKVGERVVGGGFLGLWRRMEPAVRDQAEAA